MDLYRKWIQHCMHYSQQKWWATKDVLEVAKEKCQKEIVW